ncbi:MAG: prenyltransferase/squalene oxidase repeat-containing protein [Planctomycetota bacterium]|jgi:hypothetical protein
MMRFWNDHRLEEDNFQDSVRGIVRNTPWWGISGLVHLLALLVLWQIPVDVQAAQQGARMEAIVPEPPEDVDPTEEEKPDEPEITEPVPDPVDIPEVPTVEDTDNPDNEPEGVEGDSSGPLEGPFDNAAPGLGGYAGGGKGKGGNTRLRGHKHGRGPTQDIVMLGLQWLADHQDEDGKWDCDDFMKHDPADDRCDGPGNALYDTGVSGLALLAFLGAGYTDRGSSKDKFVRTVRRGLRHLIRVQDEDGCFGSRSAKAFLYNHGIATLAMAEAFWLTRNPLYKRPAQRGLDFIARARNSYGAWRYEPRGGENDLSVTGWMVMALKSGKYAGLLIDPDAFEGARRFVDKMTDPEFGQAGYDSPGGGPARPEGMQEHFPAEKSASMTAVAILTRIFLGEKPTSEMIRKGTQICMERLPTWNKDDGSIDMYYWYYGTLAIFQVGGKPWRAWNKAMVPAIVKSQHPRKSGARTGSWDPIGPWGHDGGRVYSTALMVMCLEVYYRYDRVFGLAR